MTIDRLARNRLAELLRHFSAGLITNEDFEDGLPSSKDSAVLAISDSMWCFYDDFKKHRLEGDHALSKKTKHMISRWLMFLYSDEEYQWPAISYPGIRPLRKGFFSKLIGKAAKEKEFMSSGDYHVWPFLTEESFKRAKENPVLLAGSNDDVKRGTKGVRLD